MGTGKQPGRPLRRRALRWYVWSIKANLKIYRDSDREICRIVGRRRDQCRIAALLPVGGARYTPVLSALRPRSHLALLAADAASQLNEA